MKRYILVDVDNNGYGVYDAEANLLTIEDNLYCLGMTVQQFVVDGYEVVVKQRPDLTTNIP